MAAYAQADILKVNSTVYATKSTGYADMLKNTHRDDKQCMLKFWQIFNNHNPLSIR